jgi:hypothetical protein
MVSEPRITGLMRFDLDLERSSSPNSPYDTYSHRQKLRRAEVHIFDVKARLREWASDGCRTFTQSDGNGGIGIYGQQMKPLPGEISVIIGDALQCLRNSLDNLAFSLAKAHRPNMTPEDERDISFPIYNNAVGNGAKAIKLMDKPVKDDIRALAPNPARQPVKEDMLWLLNRTANWDKHRAVTIAIAGIGISHVFLPGGIHYDMSKRFTQKRLDTKPVLLATWNPAAKEGAEILPELQIVFDSPIEVSDRAVIGTLWRFHDHIRDTVFPRLERHLDESA